MQNKLYENFTPAFLERRGFVVVANRVRPFFPCHSEPLGEESRFRYIFSFEILRFAQDDIFYLHQNRFLLGGVIGRERTGGEGKPPPRVLREAPLRTQWFFA